MKKLAVTALVLIALGGCFDYAERLRLSPSGTAEAAIRYDMPPFMQPLAERGLFFPSTVTGITDRFPQAKPITGKDGMLLGFTLPEISLTVLDTPFVKRRYAVDTDGRFTFTLTITPPVGFASEVSAAVHRYLQHIPFLSAAKTAVVRADALAHMGPTFTVEFAAPVTTTNGIMHDNTVAWRVPVERFLHEDTIVLTAAGRLTWWQRVRSALRM